jgi:hypothetical protein
MSAGVGKAFTFHGSFNSKILAARREREIPGSFLVQRGNRYYVLKPKKIGSARNPRKAKGRIPTPRISRYSKYKVNPRKGVLIYGRVLKIYARKLSGQYKGQDFVHTFKKGALMYGMPDGSLRIEHP